VAVELPLLEKPFTQHERNVHLSAFLDITLGEWEGWLLSPTIEEVPEDIEPLLVTTIEALRNNEPQLYMQVLAQMSDSGLAWIASRIRHSEA